MKNFFILILILSSIICEHNNSSLEVKDIIKCVLNSDLIGCTFEKIKSIINSKDISIMIKSGISLFNEIKNEIVKCANRNIKELNNENEEDMDDIKLGYPKSVYVLYTQIGENAFIWYEKGGISYLKEQCHLYYGQTTWFCVYLSSS